MTLSDRPPPRGANVLALINTLEAEKHARRAVLGALLEDLRAATWDRAPESTRTLLARAEYEDLTDSEFAVLLDELHACVRAA